MKKFFIPALAAATIFAASCSKKNNTPATPQASVLVMNAWLSSLPINITANGTAINNGTNVQFLKNTGYQNIAAGTAVDLKAVYPSSGDKVTDTSITFTANTHYSVFIAGNLTAPAQVITADDLTAPATGMAKIRFVNLGTDNYSENMYFSQSAPVTSGTGYKGVTSFVSIPAATASLIVQDPNHVAQQVTVANQAFNSGKIYTVVLTGSASGTGTAALAVAVINNN